MGIMINNNFSSIEQVTGTYLKSQDAGKVAVAAENTSFEQIFKDKAFGTERELKFSKHAGSRLEQRNINLSEDQLSRLNNAAKKAGEKGIKESLMIMDIVKNFKKILSIIDLKYMIFRINLGEKD